jgi:hypothetical protein
VAEQAVSADRNVFLAKNGIVLGPDDDAAYAFVVAVATARLTTAASSRFSPRSPRARPSGPVSTAPGPRALTDLEVEPPRVTGPVASAWGAGGPLLGMQSARGRGVDRLVAVVPLDPVPRRILAQDLADRGGAGSSLRGFGLGEDPIFQTLDLLRVGAPRKQASLLISTEASDLRRPDARRRSLAGSTTRRTADRDCSLSTNAGSLRRTLDSRPFDLGTPEAQLGARARGDRTLQAHRPFGGAQRCSRASGSSPTAWAGSVLRAAAPGSFSLSISSTPGERTRL